MRRKRSERPKQDIIIEVNVKKLTRFLILLVMTALMILGGIRVVKSFMKVKYFEVTGISVYDHTEIVSASGIKRGDLLYALREEETEKRILSECPYLESVEVTPKFPNRLVIRVEGRSAQWYLELAGTKYALDGDFVVMEETLTTEGLTKLILPEVTSAMVGQVPVFGQSETEIKKTAEVLSVIRQTTFKSRLTAVNLASRWDIQLEVDGAFQILMGDMTDFEAKLKAVEAILAQDALAGYTSGQIVITKGTGGYTGAFSGT
ncbi:MAG: FtsQ-type POTRA domain-containing protein [Clostridia bacterium]|nr:FtsQ-type POTRA domain-containing protein [Clostridia bacterium]